MEAQTKKQWSYDEINCLLALWSSAEQIQSEMAAAGFDKSVGQINNKLKKLKKKRDSISELMQYFEMADEQFFQHSKEMENALLQEMRADTRSLLGLMERMVNTSDKTAQ
ncbi:hypothetical protein Q7C36_002907 [Tachysurus vachellii]|uniref:Uncharacterized protein n=1 Tax=Tachysurus vachellii TaxID=175792 RepID=A0AA88NRW1_TACVA|nr:hypothetical protein Q7C36_002907 [Tachysurus vachellii]